jgi:hypothetical protein
MGKEPDKLDGIRHLMNQELHPDWRVSQQKTVADVWQLPADTCLLGASRVTASQKIRLHQVQWQCYNRKMGL